MRPGPRLWTAAAIAAGAVAIAPPALAGASYGVWDVLDAQLGRGLAGQIVSLGVALLAGAAVYGVAVYLMRIPETRQIRDLLPIGRR